jgi:hypothetical protein
MPNFEKILNEHINHNVLLDREGVIKAMTECYNLGVEHSVIKFDKLKNTFESVLKNNVPGFQHDRLRKESGLIEPSFL